MADRYTHMLQQSYMGDSGFYFGNLYTDKGNLLTGPSRDTLVNLLPPGDGDQANHFLDFFPLGDGDQANHFLDFFPLGDGDQANHFLDFFPLGEGDQTNHFQLQPSDLQLTQDPPFNIVDQYPPIDLNPFPMDSDLVF